jgi:predicted MPP superfamily phosphohydrolase
LSPYEPTKSILKRLLTRRRFLIRLAVYGPFLLGAAYGFVIERNLPVVENVTLSLPAFPGTMRAVHLADLHVHGRSRLMDKVIELANSFEPDYIFLTGGLVEDPEELPVCLDYLGMLKSKHGIYFSPGNWEHWSGTLKNDLATQLKSAGVRMLYNSAEVIEWEKGRFFLVGIDDDYYGFSKPHRAFESQPKNVCTILLSHSPLGVYSARPYRCDLVLSGHTHGGQVRLPWIGALITPLGSGPFEQGLYTFRFSQLYVNRGIGTSTVPLRFMCPPEVTYLTLQGVDAAHNS